MTRTRLDRGGLSRPRKCLTTRDQVVGDVLRRARIRRGLSQKEAAEAYGMLPQAFISKVERGVRHVHPHELQRFAALYGVPVSDLTYSIAHAVPLAKNERRVRKTRRRRQIVEDPAKEMVFIDLLAPTPAPAEGSGDGGAAATDEGDYADEGEELEDLVVEDGWPMVEAEAGIVFPPPLRPVAMPFRVPPLGPADRKRRAVLSRLVEDGGDGALARLSIEWLPVLDAYGPDGTTALYEAVVREKHGCAAALVALGANPFRVQCFPWAADAREVTPFNAAIRTSEPGRMLRALCAAADASVAPQDGWARGAVHWDAIHSLPHGARLAEAVVAAVGA